MDFNQRVFWNNVKRLRENKGITQRAMADYLGLNHKGYNNRERGVAADPPASLTEAIAERLGTTVEELCQGEPPNEPLIPLKVANFWNNVKTRREKLGLSQKEVAAKINISPTAYQAKEACKAPKLPQDLVENIARVLETPVEELANNKIELELHDYNSQPKLSPQGRENMEISNKLYDLSHLPKSVAEYISNPDNTNLIISLIFDYLANKNNLHATSVNPPKIHDSDL